MINTNFNVRIEPIVCTPEDAFRCFTGTELDLLVVGNSTLRKIRSGSGAQVVYKDKFEYGSPNERNPYRAMNLPTFNVLEHPAELDHYLAELNRVLCPNGRLFAFATAFTILWTSLDDDVGHFRRLALPSLLDCVKRAGFQIDASLYFDPLEFLVTLAVRFLRKAASLNTLRRSFGFHDTHILPLRLATKSYLLF